MNNMQLAACMWGVCAFLTINAACQPDTNGSQAVAIGEVSACDRATNDAAASIAAGHITLKQFPPLPSPPGHGEYIQLLRERCNVEYEVISDVPKGVSRNEFAEEIACWNEAMNAEIKLKHGDNIFSELHEVATARWRKKISLQGKQ